MMQDHGAVSNPGLDLLIQVLPPPLVLMITLQGVKGALYAVKDNPWGEELPTLPEEVLTLPECILPDYGTETQHHRAIRPAFDALWNGLGYSKSEFFNSDGLWVGKHKTR